MLIFKYPLFVKETEFNSITSSIEKIIDAQTH